MRAGLIWKLFHTYRLRYFWHGIEEVWVVRVVVTLGGYDTGVLYQENNDAPCSMNSLSTNSIRYD